ncbi:hypothetical protein BKA70DRAFT_1307634 [Coprinopsis sp. MPI-PUGE-AT-0042]|nr:hypothetical protein BKA70DRAFT_1307634 [Coprinopsis sp. MPI-PUGE-AT-0042]
MIIPTSVQNLTQLFLFFVLCTSILCHGLPIDNDAGNIYTQVSSRGFLDGLKEAGKGILTLVQAPFKALEAKYNPTVTPAPVPSRTAETMFGPMLKAPEDQQK